jgi:hypothetical protein
MPVVVANLEAFKELGSEAALKHVANAKRVRRAAATKSPRRFDELQAAPKGASSEGVHEEAHEDFQPLQHAPRRSALLLK